MVFVWMFFPYNPPTFIDSGLYRFFLDFLKPYITLETADLGQ